MEQNKGIVKFFNVPKGYGFIIDDSGKEIFFHITSLLEQIAKDDSVSYTIKEGKRGLSAQNVQKVMVQA